MTKLFVIVLLSCYWLSGVSQTDTNQINLDAAEEMNEDSAIDKIVFPTFTQPVLRRISNDSMQAIKNEESFGYMQYIDSFFRNKKIPKQAIQKEEDSPATPGFFSNPGLRMLYWLMAFAAVLWIVWRMFIGKGALFTSNKKHETVNTEPATEITGNMPSSELVDKAIGEGNYRMAIRYLYLQTLQLLADKELISLAPQKTNYQYVQEVNDIAQKPVFSKLTLRYEYAWFGNFKLSANQFTTIHKEFILYHNAIASI
jgi:hypothetical protein